MKPISFQLKLSQKGVALVCVLLAMELIFVGWLYGLLQQSEKYGQELAHSKAIISRKDELLQLLSEASNSFTYHSIKQAIESHEYEQILSKFPAVVAELEELLKGQPERLQVLHDANTLITREVQTIDRIKERLIEFEKNGTQLTIEDMAKMHRVKRKAEHTRDAIIRLLFDLDAPDRKLEAELPQLEAKFRQSFRQTLLICAMFNIVLALALGLAFVRHITGRVEILVDNTIRLSKKQTLNPPLGGSDEIAHLDKTFHSVAAALREAEARDLEIQKLKEEFVAIASHELRSPLTSIQGALTMLSEGVFGELPPEAVLRIHRAENNVSRLISLINDLLDTEKMKAGKLDLEFENVDVADLITKSVLAVSDLAEGKQVEIVGVEPDAIIEADKGRLIQVLVNLLSNAIKISPKAGRIDVAVDESDAQLIEISVQDQGSGVPPQFVTTIFDKFEQVPTVQPANSPAKKQGTGLGLSIAKQIILQHGGTIGVDSEEGKGSRFWIRLPRTQAEPAGEYRGTAVVTLTELDNKAAI